MLKLLLYSRIDLHLGSIAKSNGAFLSLNIILSFNLIIETSKLLYLITSI